MTTTTTNLYVGIEDRNEGFNTPNDPSMVFAGEGDDLIDAGNDIDLLVGGYGSDIIKGFGGNDTIYGDETADPFQAGMADNILGGTGRDTVFAGGGDDFVNGEDDNDFIDGGAGNDVIWGGGGRDTLRGGDGDDDIYATDHAGDPANLIAIHIDYNGLTDAAADGNSAGTAGAHVPGGSFSGDILEGGDGNDRLHDSLGLDRMTGGAGKDHFIFETAIGNHSDIVHDFKPKDDTIELDNAYFGGIGGAGDLAGKRFYAGTSAHDANDRIIYNPKTGYLIYDQDGEGGDPGIKFARLDAGLKLTADDFLVI